MISGLINDFYSNGNECVINKDDDRSSDLNLSEIEKKIVNILETKIRPAVSEDGGDITLSSYKDGVVTVKLRKLLRLSKFNYYVKTRC